MTRSLKPDVEAICFMNGLLMIGDFMGVHISVKDRETTPILNNYLVEYGVRLTEVKQHVPMTPVNIDDGLDVVHIILPVHTELHFEQTICWN